MAFNLTTALIALAVLVLAGIGLQGVWKARRIASRASGLSVVVGDEPGARREPGMGDESPAAGTGVSRRPVTGSG